MNNIGDLATSVTTLIGVQSTLGACESSVKRIDRDPESNLHAFRSIYAPMDVARVIVEKMVESSAGIFAFYKLPVPDYD